MAKYSPDIRGKIAKFVKGHIELRSEKSERNMAKSRKSALDKKKYKDVTDRFTSEKDHEIHDPERRKY